MQIKKEFFKLTDNNISKRGQLKAITKPLYKHNTRYSYFSKRIVNGWNEEAVSGRTFEECMVACGFLGGGGQNEQLIYPRQGN